jgi:hypothetical protein
VLADERDGDSPLGDRNRCGETDESRTDDYDFRAQINCLF